MTGSPEQILAELSCVSGAVPVEALRAAVEMKDAVTEPLLDSLRGHVNKALNPEAISDDDDTLPDMAMYLLAKFRETHAFPLYEALCQLPKDRSEDWLGDMLTQDFASFLASTCGGNPAPIQRLAEDQNLDGNVRWVALDALATLAVTGAWSRAAMITWMGEIWPRWQAPDAEIDLTPLVDIAAELGASELLPMVREAFACDATDFGPIDRDEIEERCALGDQLSTDDIQPRLRYVEDPAKHMSWQARFDFDLSDMEFDDDDFLDGEDNWIGEPYVRPTPKIGRDDPCHCGSGKKYKKCCLLIDEEGPTDFAVRQ